MPAEHVATHDGRPDVRQLVLHYRRTLVRLPALQPVRLSPGSQGEDPLVEVLPADAQRLLNALVGTGDVAVQREGDAKAQLGHVRSPERIEAVAARW